MPAEASRLRRRVGRRDRWVLVVLATFAAAGTVLGVAVPGHTKAPTADCIVFDEAGVLGGGTWRLCGDAAAERCAAGEEKLAALCARLSSRRP